MIFLPANLRYLRENKKLTQGRLAEMIGVRPNTISNYENGNSSPDFESLEMLVDILDTDAHSLLFTDLSGGGVANRPRRVSDVAVRYENGQVRDGSGSTTLPSEEDVRADYDRRLDEMHKDIEILKDAVVRLLKQQDI